MKTKLKFLFTSVVVLMLLVGITGVALANVYTDLQVYASGDTVYITGDGMNAGESVGIDVGFPDGSPSQHHDVAADDSGNFADTYVLPSDAPGGIYTVTATGADSGNSFSTTFDPPANGTTLIEATKTAIGHFERTFHWTIDKSVTPDTWNLLTGDSGTSEYTITVTKDGGTDSYFVDGQICFKNDGAVATENLAIGDDILYKTGGGPFLVLMSFQVDVSSNPVLDPGETGCYPYSQAFTPVAGAQYKNSARITITNHSGHLGVPFGPSPDAPFTLPADPTLIHDSITVTDTNGGSFPFSDDGSTSYSKSFTCNDDEGQNDNTATITYDDDGTTGPSDNASVQVNCFALAVTKDASTSFDRTYHWSIDKSADQSSLTLAPNQTFLVNYTVLVTATGYTDSDWAVNGNIHVHNPAPMDATLNSVSDVVSGVGAANVDCGVTFPYTLVADGTLNCTYSADLPDATSRTNTATATLQNYSYDKDGNGTASGTTDFTGSAAVGFANAARTDVNKCVDVWDSLQLALGTLCVDPNAAFPQTFTFNYSRTVGPYSVCGDYTVENIATFATLDQNLQGNNWFPNEYGSDSWTVNVNVPCAGGCTLTIGYWKTHAGFGPQADMVTALLPQLLGTSGGAKTQNVTSAALAVQFLSFNGSNNVFDASNGINKLYAQLLGAKLSIANGADGSAIASTISAADAFLANKNSLNWSGLTKAQKNQVLSWMTTLDNYNNGLIGPGHCSQ